jgi:Arc/MetJ family transcription regulator
MTRVTIDLDDEALEGAADELGTTSEVDTVNTALRTVAGRRERVEALDRILSRIDDLDDPEVMKGAWR